MAGMAEKEPCLLHTLNYQHDSKVLRELVQRYAHMVYTTAWRIIQNESCASDVTRQTFQELARHTDKISGSTGSWLHCVATEKTVDLRRHNVHLRRSGQIAFGTQPGGGRTWQDLSCYLDEALEELDGPLKALLLDHLLIEKTTTQISQEKGISQEAAACCMHDGLEQLRAILKRHGLLFTEAALHSMIIKNARQAAPDKLLMELAEMKPVGNAFKVNRASCSRLVLFAKTHLHQTVLFASVAVGMAAITGYMIYSRSSQVSPVPVITTQMQSEGPVPKATTVKPEPTSVKTVSLPPVDRIIRTNWSTPENAVRSLMTLFEQQAGDELKQYLTQGTEETLGNPYLNCLGSPIEIIEVNQEESHAQVIYLAAVHAKFTLNNTTWRPGDALTLSARFLWVNDLWKCSEINNTSFEGDIGETEQSTL